MEVDDKFDFMVYVVQFLLIKPRRGTTGNEEPPLLKKVMEHFKVVTQYFMSTHTIIIMNTVIVKDVEYTF